MKIKINILIMLLSFACLNLSAETLTWENSLKREMEYIQAQKAVLKQQLKEINTSFEKDINSLKTEISVLKKNNNEIQESNLLLNSQIEELKKWQNLKLDKVALKISNLNSEVYSLITQKKSEITSDEAKNFNDLIPQFRTLKNNIAELNTIDHRQTIIMKSDQGLESSSVVRIGPLLSFQAVPAYTVQPMVGNDTVQPTAGNGTVQKVSIAASSAQLPGKSFVEAIQILIPTEFGFLRQADSKMITHIDAHQNNYLITPAYFYDHFFKNQKFLKSKNFADKIADFLPALFLLIVFACVGWIFLVLTKV